MRPAVLGLRRIAGQLTKPLRSLFNSNSGNSHRTLILSNFPYGRAKFVARFVDLENEISVDAVNTEGKSLWDDDLHFSPYGYIRVAELVYAVIVAEIVGPSRIQD